MPVTSFTEAARRLRGGGDFFAPCPETERTMAFDWNEFLRPRREIADLPGSPDRAVPSRIPA
jgi:hypothetical protein